MKRLTHFYESFGCKFLHDLNHSLVVTDVSLYN